MKSILSLAVTALVPLTLIVGLGAGLMLRPSVDVLLQSGAPDPHAGHNHGAEGDHESPYTRYAERQAAEEREHLPLSQQEYQNLGLSILSVEPSDYTKTVRTPGEIIEAPGRSAIKAAVPVSGRVTSLLVVPGMAIEPGEPLAELKIIDDALMQAQLRLLELLTRQEIVEAELARLAPLANAGGVAGSKRLEQQYQLKETRSSISRTKQELSMRGLTSKQVSRIVATGQAIKTLTIRTPGLSGAAPSDSNVRLSSFAPPASAGGPLTVESLLVEVGQSIERGAPVCDLASHSLLMVCGHAFEKEVGLVSRIASKRRQVVLEEGDGAGEGSLVPGFEVQHVAGHADEATQTYFYYIPLPNEVVSQSTDAQGRAFVTWRYKVGQRVHLLLPSGKIEGQFVLPRDAVLMEGPRAMVFRQLDEDPADEQGVHVKFERTPVTVLARDQQQVVVAAGESLSAGDRIADKAAYQLHLALESQKDDGGGGHDHHHH